MHDISTILNALKYGIARAHTINQHRIYQHVYKIKSKIFVNQTETRQDQARYTTKLLTKNQRFISGKPLPQVWENFTVYFIKAV